MDNTFINSENNKTFEPLILILKVTDKLVLKRGKKSIALSNLSIYCTWKNIKSSYNNNEFKIWVPTWNDTFELPDGSYSVSDSRLFWVYFRKHEENINIPSIRIYVNKIENRITFKIKTGRNLKVLTPETMKLFGR